MGPPPPPPPPARARGGVGGGGGGARVGAALEALLHTKPHITRHEESPLVLRSLSCPIRVLFAEDILRFIALGSTQIPALLAAKAQCSGLACRMFKRLPPRPGLCRATAREEEGGGLARHSIIEQAGFNSALNSNVRHRTKCDEEGKSESSKQGLKCRPVQVLIRPPTRHQARRISARRRALVQHLAC